MKNSRRHISLLVYMQLFFTIDLIFFYPFLSICRPAVRALPSKQMFEHMMKRHDVLFVYVGGESPLKVNTLPSCRTVLNN